MVARAIERYESELVDQTGDFYALDDCFSVMRNPLQQARVYTLPANPAPQLGLEDLYWTTCFDLTPLVKASWLSSCLREVDFRYHLSDLTGCMTPLRVIFDSWSGVSGPTGTISSPEVSEFALQERSPAQGDVRASIQASDDRENFDPVFLGPPLDEFRVKIRIGRIEQGRPLIAPEDIID